MSVKEDQSISVVREINNCYYNHIYTGCGWNIRCWSVKMGQSVKLSCMLEKSLGGGGLKKICQDSRCTGSGTA